MQQPRNERVAYRVSSDAHQDAFAGDPDRVPQYGGFCAYGVSVGKKFDGDPHLGLVEDGKLYFNRNEEIYGTFLEDVDGNVNKPDENWVEVEHIAARDL